MILNVSLVRLSSINGFNLTCATGFNWSLAWPLLHLQLTAKTKLFYRKIDVYVVKNLKDETTMVRASSTSVERTNWSSESPCFPTRPFKRWIGGPPIMWRRTKLTTSECPGSGKEVYVTQELSVVPVLLPITTWLSLKSKSGSTKRFDS